MKTKSNLSIFKDQNGNWCFDVEELNKFKMLYEVGGTDWKLECVKKIFEVTGEKVDVFGIGRKKKGATNGT